MKHLLSTADLDHDQAVKILDVAEEMAATQAREIKKLPTLRGKTVVNLFFEDSTRTRISFETAAKRLSADVINFSPKGSSVSKGESLKDTVLTLGAMHTDGIVVRHSASGAPYQIAHSTWTDASVINAGDGTHQHPTQSLLDAMTIRRHLKGTAATTGLPDAAGSSPSTATADVLAGQDLSGLKITIVGDVLHSRVARSGVDLFTTLGAEVALVAPATLLPVGVESWPARVFYDLDRALAEAPPDALMMLRVQRERMSSAGGGFFPSPQEYAREYGLDAPRLAALAPHTIVMHPGPMNRGLEITSAAADGPRSVIVEQVANGVAVRMATLYLTLTGAKE
ncbi:MAG: aspartate carbamoyltransferase catalytic subunit [Bifidobacteriaceae bacterium]|jgi:aspartate carbamoyltransferase catalytic subunit|nr:aspartate carbamoyltransferase catalytic subunit [Bifidobacteriaceae bacterium]